MDNLEDRIRQMKGSEILETMIKGLEREWVRVNMHTFGRRVGNICYGCAATNTICELMQRPFRSEEIGTFSRATASGLTHNFYSTFEIAIDNIRNGIIEAYNKKARALEIAELPVPNTFLPMLTNLSYKDKLPIYKEYLEWVKMQEDDLKIKPTIKEVVYV